MSITYYNYTLKKTEVQKLDDDVFAYTVGAEIFS